MARFIIGLNSCFLFCSSRQRSSVVPKTIDRHTLFDYNQLSGGSPPTGGQTHSGVEAVSGFCSCCPQLGRTGNFGPSRHARRHPDKNRVMPQM